MTRHFCDMCGKDCGEFYKDMTVIRIEPNEPLRNGADGRYEVCENCAYRST